MSRTQLVVLGSGTPNAEAGRAGSGLAIVVDDRPYLVDCGHGVVQRVVEARAAGIINWSTVDLTRLFLTHLHADHSVGLPDILFTPWIHGREEKVAAFGPRGLKDTVEHIQAAYRVNTREHLKAHPASPGGFMAEVTAVQTGLVYQDDRLRVYAWKADHGDMEAFSYKFVTPDKTIVVSGDTKPVSGFSDWARACDILAHEVYSSARFAGRPPAWRAYHSRAHTSTTELADLAKEIRPGLLVLYHQLFWGTTAADLLGEIGASYDGAVVSANDLDVF
ncbi:MAG: MBL fold metallo-hydrolase [Chloroflexota bacterium]|nr:MBL fold metallo-hydrolase [Chloroflexota bacterium]